MTRTARFGLTLLPLLLTSLALATPAPTPEIPIELAPDTALQSADFHRYASLELKDAAAEEFTVHGRHWNLHVTYDGEVATIRDHFQRLAEVGGEVLSLSGARGLHFVLNQTDGPLYARLHVAGSNYNLKLVAPSPCPRAVSFGNGVYATPRKADQPLAPPVITDYPDSRVISGDEHEFDRLELAYRLGRERREHTAEGRYWRKIVRTGEVADGGVIHHEEIHEVYRLAALAAGAEILDTGSRELVFHLPDPERGDLWAKLWPQDGKYTLTVVQEAAMRQVLVLEKDEMMARLDALGKLTLRGIFFDTARATLKPESETVLQSALELMTAYPDLVLEVGGHTDNVGQPADNQLLSEQRAASVRAWLLDHGVAGDRLRSRGYGEDRPVASNATDVGRSANRRVELTKLAGGARRELITLITPYPGSQEVAEEEVFEDRTLTFYTTDDQGRPHELEVTGAGSRRRYLVPDDRGRPDDKLSGVQIRNNYRHAVLDLGGEIMAERTHGLYFRLTDADGVATLFQIWAPGAKYSITALKERSADQPGPADSGVRPGYKS